MNGAVNQGMDAYEKAAPTAIGAAQWVAWLGAYASAKRRGPPSTA